MGTSIEIKSVRVKIDSLETREGFLVCGLPRGLSLFLSLSPKDTLNSICSPTSLCFLAHKGSAGGI